MKNLLKIAGTIALCACITGCISGKKIVIPTGLQAISEFDEPGAWTAFNGELSKVTLNIDNQDKVSGTGSIKMDFEIGDWGGMGMSFQAKQIDTNSKLFLAFKGDKSGKKARIELTDNGGERFEYIVPVTWNGWQVVSFPLSSMQRRGDWQPAGAPNDGLTLTAAEGISISPAEKSKGSWKFDALGLLP